MSRYEIIGLMSGTSLDGLDIAHVSFENTNGECFVHRVLNTSQSALPEELRQDLINIAELSPQNIYILDKKIGKFYAEAVNEFIELKRIDRTKINAIASHGQTIFHQPQNGFTVQIGCGSTIAFHTGIPVVNDFRTKDIIAGGQGAPLVPIGDFELFKDSAEAFLNIGGFSNVSFKENGIIKAFDICPGNLPLNKLVHAKGLSYDKDGEIARSGDINFFLLDLLNSLDYYKNSGPKSLGTEWLEEHFYPLLKFDKEIENNLRSVVEHIAIQITNILNQFNIQRIMVSGGGAKNTFLIERIDHYFKGTILIPDEETIEYKEAIIFAFLGALYLHKRPNTIPSVTGAERAVIGGTLHLPD
jgi:anhydro-N-acetylmuramic acid kinase